MALYEASLEVSSQWDLPMLLDTIVQRAAALSGARMSALYLVQPDSRTLQLAAGHNLPGDLIGTALRLGQGLAGRIAQTGKPMTMDDYHHGEDQAPREAYANSPLRRVFGVPLKMDRRVIGILEVVDDDQTALVSPHDLWLMGLFAEQAAIAIKNARLYEAAQHELAERKRAEEALRKGERFLASIFDSIQDGLSIFDDKLDIVRVNSTMEQWYSYAMPLVGKKCYQAYHGRSAPCEDCPAQQALATGQAAYAVVPKRSADGQVAGWLDLYAFPRLDMETGQVQGAIEYVRDITERKLVEEALYQRNRDLALLNQVSQMLTATLDLQEVTGRLITALTQTLGTEGASVWVWDSQQPGGLVCLTAAHAGLKYALVNVRLGPGEGIAGWVAQNRQSALVHRVSEDPRFCPAIDAQTGFHTLSVLAVPLRARDQVIGVLEVVNKLEGEFDAHDLALAETLAGSAAIAIENAQLVETLRRQAEELEARNEELDAFAHTVAHDLKSPLGPIIGFADALEQEWTTLSGDELRQALRDIARSAHKMNNIIDELLLLAGLRHMQVEPRPLDMVSIVSEARRRLADMIQTCRAEIVFPVASAWPEALGYAPWVEEIWVNYLSNALKYGGTPAAALRVELGATAQDDGMVRFWVRDNGPGLSPEEQAQLFTPFTRLDRVRAKGHGLGLSIVRRIVERLGGQVGVESQGAPGASVFYFTLPGAGGIAR
jgi:PAS domain S-box-containing protein